MAEAAVSGATKGIDKLESYVKKCFERTDLVGDNKKTLDDLVLKHRNTLENISEAERIRLHDIDSCDMDIKRRLGEYKKKLEANLEDLNSRQNDVDKANCMSRVKRMRTIMVQYERLVTEAREYYTTSVRPALERSAYAPVTREENAAVSALRRDRYVGGSNVPPNPPRLTLDYSSTNTYEGTLKAEILSSLRSSGRIVGVMALGLGGVGKTCALRGLAHDKDIKDKFRDGILFVQLGNDSVLSDMIMGIAETVERTGGRRLARTIRGLRTVEEASDKAGEWFQSRKCLFLVDDIWEVNGITSQELRKMGMMLSEGCLLVFTSRSKGFLDGVDKEVLFEEREAQGELAQRMLMNHANYKYSELSPVDKEAVSGILQICQGLPLALGIAGSTVRRSYCRGDANGEDAWSNYYHDLKSKDENIVTKEDGLYGPLTRIVDRSLKVLDSGSRFGRCFAQMFRGFCVVQKQQSVGGQVLRRLWSLDDLRRAREIAELFESVSLVRMQRRKGNEFCVQVHDLVLDIAKEMVTGSETTEWFRALLENYIPSDRAGTGEAEISAPEVDRVPFRPWWTVEDDGFICDNVCRVLQGAGETKELIWLLERAQWVVVRLQRSGTSGIERDLEIGMQVAEKNGVKDTELITFLRLVGSAARKCYVFVVENTNEAWYQMYGRVIWYADHCERTRVLTSEIQEYAPRPWARPSVGFLSEAGGPELETIRIEHCAEILSVSHGGTIVRILWRDRDGNGFVTEYDSRTGRAKAQRLGAQRAVKKASGVRHISRRTNLSTNSRDCTGGAFSDKQKRLVTRHRGDRIVVWEVSSGYIPESILQRPLPKLTVPRRLFRSFCAALGGTEIEKVTCVSISDDGRTMVCGSSIGGVYVRNIHSREGIGKEVQSLQILPAYGNAKDVDVSFDGKRIVCLIGTCVTGAVQVWDRNINGAVREPSAIGDGYGYVICVAISRDGKRVVSGTSGGTVRIWNVNSSTARAVRATNSDSDRVNHVVMSGDGRKIVSASHDDTVRVWDAETGSMIGQPFKLGRVVHLSVSPDGREVVSGGDDGTIRVFQLENIIMNASLRPKRYKEHHADVWCFAYCGHGMRVVTGSEDGRVRVWDATNGALLGKPLEGHKDGVRCVTVSADGARIVSGSWDGTVRVWNANTGETVGQPLSNFEGKPLGGIDTVAVNKDATRVLFSSFHVAVAVWDVDNGAVTIVTSEREWYMLQTMSADGTRIAFTSGKKSVTVWDVHTRTAVAAPFTEHKGGIETVALSGDGTRMISATWDGTVCVWDVASGKAIADPFVHDRKVVHMQSNVDGSRIVSYDKGGYGRMWDVGRGQCVMASGDPEWTSELHHSGLARYDWDFKYGKHGETMNIAVSNGAQEEQILGSTDQTVVRVGALYLSKKHGSSVWPLCTVLT